MFARDFWRSGKWHAVKDEFHLVQGPNVTLLEDRQASIRWEMSEIATGQIEYGLSSAYGSTTTEQDIAGGYSTHQQMITGLDPATLYHYRIKSTSAASVTVYSPDLTFTTSGAPLPVGTIGPRYGASGWPGFAADSWPALPGAYTLVPASVLAASNQSAALAAFLNDVALVPDGTTVVFDRTLLGAGTTYTLDTAMEIGTTGLVRDSLTFWCYNTTFVQTYTGFDWNDGRFFHFRRGGFSNFKFLGGELSGPNYKSRTFATRSVGGEGGHGLSFDSSYQTLTLQDVYIHDVLGDGIHFGKKDPADALTSFGAQGKPADLEIANCYVSGTGRQGIVVNQGTRSTINHNVVEYAALFCFDAEDETSAFNVHVDLSITDNIFRHWNVHFTVTSWWNPAAISIARTNGDPFGEQTNITVSRNRFEGGAFGYGNPSSEALLAAQGWTGRLSDGYGIVIQWYWPGLLKTNVIVEDNVFVLPADQDRSRSDGWDFTINGNAVVIDNVVGLTIQGNDFGNRGIRYRIASGTVTIADVSGIIDS